MSDLHSSIFEFRHPGERVAVSAGSILILYILYSAFIAVSNLVRGMHTHDPAGELGLELFRAAFYEMLAVFTLFCIVMFLSATFRMALAQRLLEYTARHAWQGLYVFAAIMTLTAIVLSFAVKPS